MQDVELQIEDFPDYSVDVYGNVRRRDGKVLTSTLNQQGIPSVGLTTPNDKTQYRRSVALLVAKAFLADSQYDTVRGGDTPTPIHLNGDRMNSRVDNLMWRPRWFARVYHKERITDPFPNWKKPFELLETGEIFAHPKDCAMQYGLLEGTNHGIHIALVNRTRVFPTGQSFWWYD